MFEDDVTFKLYAAAEEDDERDLDAEDAEYAEDEEEEESFSGGGDLDDADYQPPFRFTGKLDRLTVKLAPLNATEERHLQQNIQNTKNKAQ